MRALDPEVIDVLWRAFEARIPRPQGSHPLGCHRPRVSDRLCFQGIMIRLTTGCSWTDVEQLLGGVVSDTTVRARRDEWVTAGGFDALADEAIDVFDRIVGLDLSEVGIDGSQHKAPAGGLGTGKNPTDRAKLGWKWSLAVDTHGVPIAWSTDGANRNDCKLVDPTLAMLDRRGLLCDIETVHLDRGYDHDFVRELFASAGIDDAVIVRRRQPSAPKPVMPELRLGLRWIVERTNSWLARFGQLRRNTDRHPTHRLAQLALAIAALITAKLIDWRNRWNPDPAPIR